MQNSDIPGKLITPFASGAGASYIRAIPTGSQIGITDGRASLVDGFPPFNFNPVASGGIPPDGRDMNGILNMLSAWSRWQAAGGFVSYDAAFSSAIGGYPIGSVLQGTALGIFWICMTNNNTTNPDAGGSGWMALRSGLGGFSVYNANTTFTVPTFVNKIRVKVVGAGGGGGGTGTTGTGGGGGGGGGYAEALFDVVPGASYAITIGAGGAGSSSSGANGGTTSFGALISATGGQGGGAYTAPAAGGAGGVGSVGLILQGSYGGDGGSAGTGNIFAGNGGAPGMGGGAGRGGSGGGIAGVNGGGGGGAYAISTGAVVGGNGGGGYVVVES